MSAVREKNIRWADSRCATFLLFKLLIYFSTLSDMTDSTSSVHTATTISANNNRERNDDDQKHTEQSIPQLTVEEVTRYNEYIFHTIHGALCDNKMHLSQDEKKR